jgi:membrane fusion protein (multidrug efflux system)
METMAVAVEAAARGDIATYYRATASLDPDKQAEVLVRVQGPVRRIVAEEGDDVRQGQVLLFIDDTEYRHRLTQAKVALEQQKAKFARVQTIIAQGLVSVEEFDNAKSLLEAAEAAYELAALELSWCEVRAPFSGRIVRRAVDQGQNVSSGTALFTIVDMHRLLARVHVPAREFRRIQTDQPVEFRVDSTGDRLTGRIDLISPIVDPRTGTIKVTVEITEYPPSTRPGNFAEVSIVTDKHTGALVVPNTAVLTDKDQRIVYVADGETARRTVVEVGYEDDRFVEILGGIEEGTKVVVQGQRSLSDGQPLKILDSMTLGTEDAETTTGKPERTQGAG